MREPRSGGVLVMAERGAGHRSPHLSRPGRKSRLSEDRCYPRAAERPPLSRPRSGLAMAAERPSLSLVFLC